MNKQTTTKYLQIAKHLKKKHARIVKFRKKYLALFGVRLAKKLTEKQLALRIRVYLNKLVALQTQDWTR